MAIEYEIQVLDIEENEIKAKLQGLNAEFISENLMKRWVFDMSEDDSQEWIRLRDDGTKVNITYKKRGSTDIGNTEEIEIIVNDFEKTADILNKLQFKDKYYQENKRTLYKLGNTEFCIDSWPKIPIYLEIESTSEEEVRKGIELLGLENHTYGDFGAKRIYSKYGLDIHSFKELKF